MHISYTFAHGFGTDAHFWEPLLSYVHVPYTLWERGYYGAEQQKKVHASTIRIGIGHSLGLLQLLMSDIHFDACIGIQSFIDFLGEKHYTTRLQELKTLHTHIARNPEKSLRLFCKRAGLPHTNITQRLCKEAIVTDIEVLYGKYYAHTATKNIYFFVTNDDIVVPRSLVEENIVRIQEKNLSCIASMSIAPNAQHALGFLHPEYIAEQIVYIAQTIGSTS